MRNERHKGRTTHGSAARWEGRGVVWMGGQSNGAALHSLRQCAARARAFPSPPSRRPNPSAAGQPVSHAGLRVESRLKALGRMGALPAGRWTGGECLRASRGRDSWL